MEKKGYVHVSNLISFFSLIYIDVKFPDTYFTISNVIGL